MSRCLKIGNILVLTLTMLVSLSCGNAEVKPDNSVENITPGESNTISPRDMDSGNGTWNPKGFTLIDVWGSSSRDVFAVGSKTMPTPSLSSRIYTIGIIMHYDGNLWSEMKTGDIECSAFHAIWGSSSSDIFVLGENGTILHYDGDTWEQMNSGTNPQLYSIWGSSSSDVFALGLNYDYAAGEARNTVIFHYDGNTWTEMESDIKNGLVGIWGTSSRDVFTVGRDSDPIVGDTLHYDGTILHYDGFDWSKMEARVPEGLSDIWGNSYRNVFAVGYGGLILHYNGAIWREMESGTTSQLRAVWGSSSSDVFAVGLNWDYVAGEQSGIILHYDGNTWSKIMESFTRIAFLGVWGTSSSDVFVAGSNGILHCDGNTWTEMDINLVWPDQVELNLAGN